MASMRRIRLRAKFALWSFQNWRKGYRWGPIQRCRWCDHTSPYHYPTCRKSERAKRLAAL